MDRAVSGNEKSPCPSAKSITLLPMLGKDHKDQFRTRMHPIKESYKIQTYVPSQTTKSSLRLLGSLSLGRHSGSDGGVDPLQLSARDLDRPMEARPDAYTTYLSATPNNQSRGQDK